MKKKKKKLKLRKGLNLYKISLILIILSSILLSSKFIFKETSSKKENANEVINNINDPVEEEKEAIKGRV